MGKKREKRKYGATQEKAAGSELRRILLVMKITFGAKKKPHHILSEFHRLSHYPENAAECRKSEERLKKEVTLVRFD